MSASPPYESGLRPYRLEYVAETSVGAAPSNPTWNRFSDNIRSFEPGISGGVESQYGLGSPDSQNAFAGTNADTVTVAYDLQQKSSSGNTLLDNGSNPNDAITDGFQRDSDNRIQNTHTIVRRITQSSLTAANTVNGSTSHDTRQYVVVSGGYPNEPTLTGDPNDPQPVLAQLVYEAEKIRTYQIDQPSSSTTLDVSSSSTSDTSQTLEIEDEDAGTTESVSLSGTSTVTTSASFADIDAAHLDAETVGDITISENGGDDLMVIKGQNSYDHGEGDLGVPALGSGSHASAIGQSYELYHNDAVEQPNGTTIADGFETVAFSATNNVTGTNQGGTPRRALAAGNQEPTAEIVVFGETEMHDRTVDHLTTATDNLRWEMDGGTIQLDSADVREVSPDPDNVNQDKRMTTLTFSGQGVTLST